MGGPTGVGGGGGSSQVDQRQQVGTEWCWVGIREPGEELPSASDGSGISVKGRMSTEILVVLAAVMVMPAVAPEYRCGRSQTRRVSVGNNG